MKNKFIFLLCFIFLLTFLLAPKNIEAKTLRNLYNELNQLKSQKTAQDKAKYENEYEKKNTNNEIYSSTKGIEDCENKIEEAKQKTIQLDADILKKQEEINELMEALHKSDSGNEYLEYVFGATTITEFIYRSAVVEQLSKHNEEKITEMYNLIEENKQAQIDLKNRKLELETLITELQGKLKDINSELSEISEIQVDLAAQIKAQEESIKYYKDLGCEMDEDISKCVTMPYAMGFTRPLTSGRITSNFGYRVHPTRKTYSFHNAVDIGGNPEGTPIYASAAGVVAAKVNKSSCGGNSVYIHHSINGVKYTTQYLHLLRFNVNIGDVVTSNTIIGYVGGSTTKTYDKCTTGAHLHFGIGSGWYLGNGYTNFSTWTNNCKNPKDLIYFPNRWLTRYY